MRVSTVTIFEQSMRSLNQQQAEFSRVGEQIASGKRVVRPSDDPLAASRAVRTSQALGVTNQYADARVSARNALSQQEGILGSVTDTLTRARTLMVQASTGTLSDADRTSIASELRGLRETILGQANATDGNGTYLFGGYNDSSEPFVRDATGTINYVGDGNSREQRIDSSRLMPVTDNGETVFQSVHQGAGYVAEADDANTGSLIFNGPRVIDVNDPEYGNSFELAYDAGTDEFTITNTTTGDPPQTVPRPGTGSAILEFGGLSITLEGEPADGDSITVDVPRNGNINTDLFATLDKAIAVLDTPAETPEEQAKLANTSKTVMREMDNSLDNILTHRASVGARLNELDILDRVGENREINYSQNLSDLVDLNYVDAISEYSLRQVGLQAAQKAFVDVKGLSLFNFMK